MSLARVIDQGNLGCNIPFKIYYTVICFWNNYCLTKIIYVNFETNELFELGLLQLSWLKVHKYLHICFAVGLFIFMGFYDICSNNLGNKTWKLVLNGPLIQLPNRRGHCISLEVSSPCHTHFRCKAPSQLLFLPVFQICDIKWLDQTACLAKSR